MPVAATTSLSAIGGDAAVAADEARDVEFARVLSEMRLVKDAWELEQLQEACDITTLGFADSVREWDNVLKYGERWIEGTFFRRARAMEEGHGHHGRRGGGRRARPATTPTGRHPWVNVIKLEDVKVFIEQHGD